MTAEMPAGRLPLRVWRRVRVILIAYLVLLVPAGGLAVPPAARAEGVVHAVASVAAGWLTPFVIDPSHWSVGLGGGLVAAANFALLIAHPVRPGAGTAALTILGVALWLFFGLAVATVGV